METSMEPDGRIMSWVKNFHSRILPSPPASPLASQKSPVGYRRRDSSRCSIIRRYSSSSKFSTFVRTLRGWIQWRFFCDTAGLWPFTLLSTRDLLGALPYLILIHTIFVLLWWARRLVILQCLCDVGPWLHSVFMTMISVSVTLCYHFDSMSTGSVPGGSASCLHPHGSAM